MSKFRNKYLIESARAQWWDYGKKAAYFITICTKGEEPYFGTVENEQMQLFPAGVLADVLWCEIQHHFPHVFLVIMSLCQIICMGHIGTGFLG
jgi:hypothetical protein